MCKSLGEAVFVVREDTSAFLDEGNEPWYALYTRHQHEKTVAQVLENKGHQVFLPLYSVVHRWQDRMKQLRLPLFPCYVFFRGGLGQQVEILRTLGACMIVKSGGCPAAISEAEIQAVRRVVESALRIEPHPLLKCGDRVRVRSGPLQGVEGFLVRKKNVFRLVISLELLGRSAAVEVDVCNVEQLYSPRALVLAASSNN